LREAQLRGTKGTAHDEQLGGRAVLVPRIPLSFSWVLLWQAALCSRPPAWHQVPINPRILVNRKPFDFF